MLTTVGAGVYTSSDVKLKNVLGQGGVIFIRQFKSNLSLGAGLAVNNTFGYPMVFPAIYFDWSTEGRYQIKVSMLNAMEVSAGMKMNKYLNLRIVAEMNGSLALLEREGKDTMFSPAIHYCRFTTGSKYGEFFFQSLLLPVCRVAE